LLILPGRFVISSLVYSLLFIKSILKPTLSQKKLYTKLSIRAGLSLLELQALLGHSSSFMTQLYVEMLDDDLIDAHKEHGPVDNLL